MATNMRRAYTQYYFEDDGQIAQHIDTIRAHLALSQRVEPWMILVLEEAARRLRAMEAWRNATANDNKPA